MKRKPLDEKAFIQAGRKARTAVIRHRELQDEVERISAENRARLRAAEEAALEASNAAREATEAVIELINRYRWNPSLAQTEEF